MITVMYKIEVTHHFKHKYFSSANIKLVGKNGLAVILAGSGDMFSKLMLWEFLQLPNFGPVAVEHARPVSMVLNIHI